MSTHPAEAPMFISTYDHDGEKRFFAFSRTEVTRASHLWAQILPAAGLSRGDRAVVISVSEDAHAALPLEEALERAGILNLQAEGSMFDGARIEAFIRNFDPAALFGVCRATLDGLAALGHDVATLFRGRSVWARDDAVAALQGLDGVELRRWANLGPAMLIGCGHHPTGMHLDGTEWDLRIDADRVTLSHRMGAAAPEAVTLTVPGVTRLQAPCRCGIASPLVEMATPA